jgi:predicted HTH transcriptional regulator
VQELRLDDLSITSIGWAQARHRTAFGSPSGDVIEFLSHARLIEPFVVDEENEPRYRVRLAALILFGKQQPIAQHLSCFETILTTSRGTVRLRKNLVETIRELVLDDTALLRQHCPDVAVRTLQELLVNAYIHRCWRTAAPVVITISDDLTIQNPGGLLAGLSTGNLLYGIPQYRNFALAEAARFSGVCDKIGQGINIIFETIISGGLPFPEFASDDDTFRAQIRMARSADFAEFVRRRATTLSNIDEIMALRLCWDRDGRISLREIRDGLQRDSRSTRLLLENMCKKNILESANGSEEFQLTHSIRRDIATVFSWDQYQLFQ